MKALIAAVLPLLASSVTSQIPLSAARVRAPSAIVLDADTGRVLWQKNAFQRRAMASTTKMMTAICARDFTRLPRSHRLRKSIRSVFRVSRAAQNFTPSSARLVAGDRLILRDLLYALLLPSGNDAANVIAEGCLGSRSAFVDYMNRRARALGLSDTQFRNAHGLDASGHRSSAFDLARLARVFLQDAELRRIVLTPNYSTRSLNGRRYSWSMTNRLVRNGSYAGIIGVKTGTTDNAGECLVAAARRGNRTVISVVLGDPRSSGLRYVDTPLLLDYGFDALFHRMPNPIVRADFNADGYPDVAIGMPQATVGNRAEAGKVAVLLGGRFGLDMRFPRFVHQDSAGVAGGAETRDHFGAALAVGNFNGDAFLDLAVGVPGEDIGSERDAGAIHVIYGTRTGLDPRSRSQIFYGDQAALPFTGRPGDAFGSALAAGDFDRDGRDDLAVGMPGYDRTWLGRFVTFGRDVGAIFTFAGSASGLGVGASSRFLTRERGFVVSGAGTRFGTVLHAADFDGNEYVDLAIGSPSWRSGRGTVDVVDGGEAGLDASTLAPITAATAQAGDHYGYALASADFDGDGRLDLAVGAPGATVDDKAFAGEVRVHLAGSGGIRSPFTTLRFDGDSPGIPGSANARDRFGAAITVGSLDASGLPDLAIGVPGDDKSVAAPNSGAVVVLYGRASRVSTIAAQRITQDSLGLSANLASAGEAFGASLHAGRFHRFARPGLAIGVAGELRPGFTHFLGTGTSGVDPTRGQIFTGRAEGLTIGR